MVYNRIILNDFDGQIVPDVASGSPRALKFSFSIERFYKVPWRELLFEPERGLDRWDSSVLVVAMKVFYWCCELAQESENTVLKTHALFSLHVQDGKEHLFIVGLLPFLCSCFPETTTKYRIHSVWVCTEMQGETGALFIMGSKLLEREIVLVKLQCNHLLLSLQGHFTGKLMLQ